MYTDKKNLFYSVLFGLTLLITATACNNRPQIADEKYTWVITDSTLEAAVVTEFSTHPYVSSENIEVKLEDGIVTLYGSTDNLLESEQAADLASATRGVKSVINLIEIEPVLLSDEEIKIRVDDAFYRDPVLESFEIHVRVDSAVVNLYGRVDSWHEKQLAGEVARSVEGIRKVNNSIAFVYMEEVPDMDIIASIESLLQNDMRINDGLIEVSVNQDTVILSGKVGSASEKSLAVVHSHVAGVDTVIADQLEVSQEQRDPLMRKDKFVDKTDYQIIEAIQQTFLQDPRLLNHDIKVKSEDGIVTLSGKVNNLRAKNAAAEDAMNVVGVWKVKNNIDVEPVAMPVEKTVIDNVSTAIDYHPLFDDYKIIATEEDGRVTLEGEVKFYFEKIQAEDVVSGIPGVVDITNKIEVTEGIEFPYAVSPETEEYPVIRKPRIKSDEKIKEDIEYQLWWSPFVDRNQVDVAVENGKVTLTGTVNSRIEMDYAVRNAYEGGAFEVVNKLKVEFWQI